MHNVLCHVVTFCRETGSDLNIQEEQCRQGNWKEGEREGLVVDYVRISLLWLISGARSLSHTHSLSLSLSPCVPLCFVQRLAASACSMKIGQKWLPRKLFPTRRLSTESLVAKFLLNQQPDSALTAKLEDLRLLWRCLHKPVVINRPRL